MFNLLVTLSFMAVYWGRLIYWSPMAVYCGYVTVLHWVSCPVLIQNLSYSWWFWNGLYSKCKIGQYIWCKTGLSRYTVWHCKLFVHQNCWHFFSIEAVRSIPNWKYEPHNFLQIVQYMRTKICIAFACIIK